MATELASAYITLIPSLKGAASTIQRELAGIDGAAAGRVIGSSVSSSMGKDLASAIGKVGGVFSSTFGRAAKVGVGAVTAIGTAIGGLAATGGMSRALNMEKAETMFKGLKLDWTQFKDTVNEAVTGTAFGMDVAALSAASLAASGVKAGDEMKKALNGAVGVAATFGADLGDIGQIFSKVAAQGKLSGEVIQQFADRGINVVSVLSEQLGKTGDEVRKMVKDGKVDFQTFSDAMYAAFGDSAMGANETFSGSMANMRSSVSRLGEKFMTVFRDGCIPVFNAVREAVNAVSAKMAPLVEKFSELASVVQGRLVGALNAFKTAVEEGQGPMAALAAGLDSLGGEGTAAKISSLVGTVATMATVGAILKSAAKGAQVAQAALNKLGKAASAVGAGLSAGLKGAASFALKMGTAGKDAAKAFTDGLFNGMRGTKIDGALNAVATQVGSAMARVKGRIRESNEAIAEELAKMTPRWAKTLGAAASSAVAAFKARFNPSKAAGVEGTRLARAVAAMKSGLVSGISAAGTVFSKVAGGAVQLAGALAPMAGALLATGVAAVAAGADVRGAMDGALAQVQAFADNLPATVQDVVDYLPLFINRVVAMAPQLVQALTTALGAISQALPAIIPVLTTGITQMITALVPVIVSMVPFLLQAGIQLFTALVNSLSQVLPVIVEMLPGLVATVCTVLQENMPVLLEGAKTLFRSLLEAFTTVLPELVAMLPELISGICTFLIENLPTLLVAGLQLFMALVSAFLEMLPQLIAMLPNLIIQVMDKLIEFGPQLLSSGKDLFMKICEAVPKILDALLSALVDLLQNLPPKIIAFAGEMGNAAQDMVRGMIDGIGRAAGAVWNKITEVCSGALDAVKSFFGIASPSKVMREMFGYVGEGMCKGLSDKAASVSRTMEGIARNVEREAAKANPVMDLAVGYTKEQGRPATIAEALAIELDKRGVKQTVYQMGDVTLDVKELKDVPTLEQFYKIAMQAKRW